MFGDTPNIAARVQAVAAPDSVFITAAVHQLVSGLFVVEDRKTADNGEMVIALLRGSDVTLKKFYRDPGGKIRLQPANAAMQPIFADPDQVQVQGVVVGVMRKY